MKVGRPLRFLAIAISGWTAGRAVMLWPIAHDIMVIKRPIQRPASAMLLQTPPVGRSGHATAVSRSFRTARTAIVPPIGLVAVADRPAIVPHDGAPFCAEPPIVSPIGWPVPLRASPRRFAVSAWLIARQEPRGSSTSGRLGGSQLGVRATFMIDRASRIALSARLSAALAGVGREAAIGVDWQPLDAPLHLIAERRVALDGGKDGIALLAIGGIAPRQVLPRVAIAAYGQAGAIVRHAVEPFADGAARVSYDLGSVGGFRLDAGAGAWGGTQNGAARLDLGPSLGARLPIAQRAIRVTLDWRHRVAGAARPGSGPVLSIGSDF